MKLIPWTPPGLSPEVGAVLVPQQKAAAVTWQDYLGFLELQLDKMLRVKNLDALLEEFRLPPLEHLPRASWPEMLLREDPVLTPLSRGHSHHGWPQKATADPASARILGSPRSLRAWLARLEGLAEGDE